MDGFDRTLRNKKVLFLDLDGTVYMGDTLLPGVQKFLDYLNKQNKHFYFLSNNSSRSKKDYVRKLNRLGIRANEEQVILSTDGVIEFLLDKGVKNVFVMGTQSMRTMFHKAGLNTESASPDYVVLGFDTELTYAKLKKAALFIQNGVEYIATHPDVVCPTPEGFIPDTGSMIALLESATHRPPLKIFGKPNPEMVAHVLQKYQVPPPQVVMIGDRIYTDMELARRISCDFILVLSGETRRKDLKNLKELPALVVENIGEIINLNNPGLFS